MKKIITGLLLLASIPLMAQKDSVSPLSFTGYLETYYSYDFTKPDNHSRPSYVYSHNRTNEVNLNLALLKASYSTERIRGNLALAAGTYMNANLSSEPGVLKNIYEANAGFKLTKRSNLWLDAGIFTSHIGFESAIGKDCWNLTRSILADNSPYYESGVKISYSSPNKKWFISILLLNGWQRIQRVDGNHTPGFGHQLSYKPSENITLNSSSFLGNDKPDVTRQMRYFHNFYGQFQLTEKFGLITGFDIGAEQVQKASSAYNTWYSPVVILRYKFPGNLAIAARTEYYSDKNGVIISSGNPNGFREWGYSINLDGTIGQNLLWRLEARNITSSFITSSLAISF